MDWRRLFTGFDGRIGAKEFWPGAAILIVFMLIAMVIIYVITIRVGGPRLAMALLLLAQLLLLYPGLALISKRLHDRNRATSYSLFLIVPWLLASFLGAVGITDPANPYWLDHLLRLILLVVTIWFLIELGFGKGTAGANDYGPDPQEGAATS